MTNRTPETADRAGPAEPANGAERAASAGGSAPRQLTDAAKRALNEAELRRQALQQQTVNPPAEIGGRGGLDPVRYGDWEAGGIASDF